MKGQQFNVEPNQKVCVLNIADAKVGDEIIFDKVPRNPTGKIEKPALRKKYGAAELVAQPTEE